MVCRILEAAHMLIDILGGLSEVISTVTKVGILSLPVSILMPINKAPVNPHRFSGDRVDGISDNKAVQVYKAAVTGEYPIKPAMREEVILDVCDIMERARAKGRDRTMLACIKVLLAMDKHNRELQGIGKASQVNIAVIRQELLSNDQYVEHLRNAAADGNPCLDGTVTVGGEVAAGDPSEDH
jgi:hypothetical protein